MAFIIKDLYRDSKIDVGKKIMKNVDMYFTFWMVLH